MKEYEEDREYMEHINAIRTEGDQQIRGEDESQDCPPEEQSQMSNCKKSITNSISALSKADNKLETPHDTQEDLRESAYNPSYSKSPVPVRQDSGKGASFRIKTHNYQREADRKSVV